MLAIALAIGVYQQVPGAWQAGVFPVYLHVLVFGWLTQFVFGIAIWMLPKWSSALPRGREWVNWGIYASLNAGLVLRMVFEPLHDAQLVAWSGTMLVISATLQWLAGISFAWQAWTRVKGR